MNTFEKMEIRLLIFFNECHWRTVFYIKTEFPKVNSEKMWLNDVDLLSDTKLSLYKLQTMYPVACKILRPIR